MAYRIFNAYVIFLHPYTYAREGGGTSVYCLIQRTFVGHRVFKSILERYVDHIICRHHVMNRSSFNSRSQACVQPSRQTDFCLVRPGCTEVAWGVKQRHVAPTCGVGTAAPLEIVLSTPCFACHWIPGESRARVKWNLDAVPL